MTPQTMRKNMMTQQQQQQQQAPAAALLHQSSIGLSLFITSSGGDLKWRR